MAGPLGSLTAWLLDPMRRRQGMRPQLRLIERISLAPRQSLALIEVEGKRLLVATAPEGAPTFHPLEPQSRHAHAARSTVRTGRVSW